MSLPELERLRVDERLQLFANRVPPDVRPHLSFVWTVRGNEITLREKRPAFRRPGEFTESAIARFRFDPKSHEWCLQWRDRNGKFHDYEGFEAVRQFDSLVAEVESDPSGIFMG